jgi:hypothetical protein
VIRLSVALCLLLVAGGVTVIGPLLETRLRAPEGTARAYLRAVEQGNVDAALDLIEPSRRDALRERVALQRQNRYEVASVVLGRPSLIDRVLGRQMPPAWVIVTADVTTMSGERWRSTSTASLVEQDGVWLLVAPLFA